MKGEDLCNFLHFRKMETYGNLLRTPTNMDLNWQVLPCGPKLVCTELYTWVCLKRFLYFPFGSTTIWGRFFFFCQGALSKSK